MSLTLMKRVPSAELLDTDLPADEAEESLKDIEWVHRHLGGRRLVRKLLLPLLTSSPGQSLLALDLGCGSGHVGRDLERIGSQGRAPFRVLGLDQRLAHARLSSRGSTLNGDAFRIPLQERSVDIVFSTLFLHHFGPSDLGALLKESARVARRTVAALDLSRGHVALGLISLIGPIAFRSRVSVSDGKASVRQAYTPREMEDIACQALPGGTVQAEGPFAWTLVWHRP